MKHQKIIVQTRGQGLYEFTDQVNVILRKHEPFDGMCHLFVRHTSASLIIQENADPSVQTDLQAWLKRLVPERDSLFTHTTEGPDDMPAHVKSVLTATSLSIPVIDGELALGTWQGIYLWEHRAQAHQRQIIVSII